MATETEIERATALHAQLKSDAAAAYLMYFSARTPAELQNEMKALVQADLQPDGTPTDPTQVVVKNGDSVVVISNGGFPAPGSPGVASVINSTLQCAAKRSVRMPKAVSRKARSR